MTTPPLRPPPWPHQERARDDDGRAGLRPEPQLDLRLDLGLARDLGIMDERLPRLGVRRQLARARLLEALDDRRLAGAVGADDERQGAVELDHVLVVGREAADALDEQLSL